VVISGEKWSEVVFIGMERAKVDSKGRIFFPARFRQLLPDGEVGITLFWDRCLEVYPGSYLMNILKQLLSLNRADPEIRWFQRYVMSNTQLLNLDGEGRLLIPQRLREQAGINKEVLIIGTGDHLEIWSPERYKTGLENFSPESIDASKIPQELWYKLWGSP